MTGKERGGRKSEDGKKKRNLRKGCGRKYGVVDRRERITAAGTARRSCLWGSNGVCTGKEGGREGGKEGRRATGYGDLDLLLCICNSLVPPSLPPSVGGQPPPHRPSEGPPPPPGRGGREGGRRARGRETATDAQELEYDQGRETNVADPAARPHEQAKALLQWARVILPLFRVQLAIDLRRSLPSLPPSLFLLLLLLLLLASCPEAEAHHRRKL